MTALGDNSTEFEGPTLHGLDLSGRFVAYGLTLTGERYQGSGFTEAVERLNIQTGRRERVPANGAKGNGFGEKSPGITDIVATPAGSVAWLIEGPFSDPTNMTPAPGVVPPGSKAIYDVAADSATPTLVAYNSKIATHSLAAIPGYLYWTEGGQPREVAIE